MNVPEKVWVTVGTLRKLGEYVPPGIAQKLLDISTEWEQFCEAVQSEQEGMDSEAMQNYLDQERASGEGMAGAD